MTAAERFAAALTSAGLPLRAPPAGDEIPGDHIVDPLNLDPTQLPPETRILPLARAAGWDAGSVLKLTQALIEQDSIGHEDVWELYEADTIGEILQLIERRYPAPAGAIPDEEDGFHDEKRERADGQAD